MAIEISRVTADTYGSFIRQLQGCWKSASLLWLHANGFPILPGFIIDAWEPESEAAISRFCRERNFSELLVRIEKRDQRWTSRRGGYIVPLKEARRQVEELANEGMFAILLEPVSPYSDMYSLTSVSDLETGTVSVEVVGAGFDASDILRADTLPHERFEVSLGHTRSALTADSLRIKRLHVIGVKEYRAAVQQRLAKIGAKLRNPAYPDRLMGANISGRDREVLIDEAMRFLSVSGKSTLLDQARVYEPIPSGLFGMYLERLVGVIERIRASKIRWRTLSLASSFLSQDRFVIWDFFPPGENDTSVLCAL